MSWADCFAEYADPLLRQADRTYKITLKGSGPQDAALYLLNSCTTPALNCEAGQDATTGSAEQITYTAKVTQDFFIGVDGKVFLCRRKPAIGDLEHQALDEIWASNERDERLEQMRSCEESILSLSYTND